MSARYYGPSGATSDQDRTLEELVLEHGNAECSLVDFRGAKPYMQVDFADGTRARIDEGGRAVFYVA